ncbi:MFS transporter [Paenibacillus tarimensis]
MIGLGLSAAAYLLYIWIPPQVVVGVIILHTVGYCLISGAIDALFFDSIPAGYEDRYSALYSLFYRIALGLSALGAGLMSAFAGYAFCFYSSAFTCLLSLVLLWKFVSVPQGLNVEQNAGPSLLRKHPLHNLRPIFASRIIYYFVILGFAIDAVHIPLENFLPVFLKDAGFSNEEIGYFARWALLPVLS